MSLADLLAMLPAKYRKWLYLVLGVAGLVWSVYEMANHNWSVALGLLMTSIIPNAVAHSNVPLGAASSGSDSSQDSAS